MIRFSVFFVAFINRAGRESDDDDAGHGEGVRNEGCGDHLFSGESIDAAEEEALDEEAEE
jgi:hypothetical protein